MLTPCCRHPAAEIGVIAEIPVQCGVTRTYFLKEFWKLKWKPQQNMGTQLVTAALLMNFVDANCALAVSALLYKNGLRSLGSMSRVTHQNALSAHHS